MNKFRKQIYINPQMVESIKNMTPWDILNLKNLTPDQKVSYMVIQVIEELQDKGIFDRMENGTESESDLDSIYYLKTFLAIEKDKSNIHWPYETSEGHACRIALWFYGVMAPFCNDKIFKNVDGIDIEEPESNIIFM